MKKEFLHYNSEDFAAEQSFIDWVKSDFKQFNKEWTDWLVENPQMQDAISEAKQFLSSIQISKHAVATNTDALWQRIAQDTQLVADLQVSDNLKQVSAHPVVRKMAVGRRRLLYLGAAAAAIATLLLLNPGMFSATQIQTTRAQSLSHILPDQSEVRLNSESEIQYNKKKWAEQRSLTMRGEAFFDVEKGSTFTVSTPRGNVEVLGTEFNIFSRGNQFKVKCTEGSVRVSNDHDQVIIVQGQTCALVGGQLVTLSEPKEEVEWLNNVYRYDGTQLDQVIKELQRQFDIEISASANIRNLPYTGAFSSTDLDQALYDVFWPMGFEANKSGRKQVIISDSPE